jgi:hypothetical protein
MYVYIESEHHAEGSLWTVGFYSPLDGKWNPESDHESRELAADRVHWLNGGHEGRIETQGSWEEYQYFKKTHGGK